MKPSTLRIAVAATAIVATFGVLASAGHTPDARAMSANRPGSTLLASNSAVVAIVATPSGGGSWHATRDGGVFASGDAKLFGSAGGIADDAIVGMASTPDGGGYWLVDQAGGVFSFGNAAFFGSIGGRPLRAPIVGMAARPDGNGYWLVASDGGVFAFNAAFMGSMGGQPLRAPIVGMAARPDGNGYWLVASDGGVFAFNAAFMGSMGGQPLRAPIVGMTAVPRDGYVLAAADGGLFAFGPGAPFFGSATGSCPTQPAVGVAVSRGIAGYWIAFADARTYFVSPSTPPPACELSNGGLNDREADLLTRLNQERAARGLAPLEWDSELADYAANWSADMSVRGFRHSDVGVLLGAYNFSGENIAMGSRGVTPGQLHGAWMHSDGHRANMLEPGYTHVGIGAYCAPDGSVWLTQSFGRPATAGPPPGVHDDLPPVEPVARPDAGALAC